MTEPRVLDHTALIALFDGNRRAFALWRQADENAFAMILPAAAIAEANNVLGGTVDTWRAVLDGTRVIVTPLDLSTAIDSGPLAGELAVRQVIHEARQVQGAIITRAPWLVPGRRPTGPRSLKPNRLRARYVPVAPGRDGEPRGTAALLTCSATDRPGAI